MRPNLCLSIALLTLSIIGLESCGGGSETTVPPPVAITFNPNPLVATYPQGDPSGQNIEVTTANLPANQPLIIKVTEPNAIIKDGLVHVTLKSGSIYNAFFMPSADLLPGQYSGNLTLSIAPASAPNSPLPISGNVLPYQFTVAQGTTITGTINGQAIPGFAGLQNLPFGGQSLKVRHGQVVEFTSTAPIQWSTSTAGGSVFPIVSLISTSTTNWKATITSTNATAASQGYVFFEATTLSGPVRNISFQFEVIP